jgi:hypothetical protein
MHYYFDSTYSSGGYDTTVYNGANSSSAGGSLADTGTYVLAFVRLAAFIIFVALIVRIWKRTKKPTPTKIIGTTETLDGAHQKM